VFPPFYALGDTGTGEEGQYEVGKAMDRAAKVDQPVCVMLLGDNFYPRGVTSTDDPQWETTFEKPYAGRNLQIPFYACLGNHDHGGNVRAQLDKNVISKRWKMPGFNYSFFPDSSRPDLVEMFIIDTDPHRHDKDIFEKSVKILEANLAKSKARWNIVAGHHPLQSGGRASYFAKRLEDQLLDVLVEHHVDLYLCGHDHHMEMGTVDELIAYAVIGSGAEVRPKIVMVPNLHFAASRLGFAKLKITPDQVIVRFTTETDEAIYTEAITK
jgi:acid phosphatase